MAALSRSNSSAQAGWMFVLLSVVLVAPMPPIYLGFMSLLAYILIFRDEWYAFFDWRCGLLFLLCFSNAFVSLIGIEYKSPGMYQHLLYPLVFYVCGRAVFCCDVSGKLYGAILCSLVVVVAAPVCFSVAYDVLQNGLTNVARGVVLLGSADVISPTVLAGRVVGCVSLVALGAVRSTYLGGLARVGLLALSTFGLFVGARLGSRTLIIIFAVALLVGLVINLKGKSAVIAIALFGLVGVLILPLLTDLVSILDVLSAFRDRIDNDDYGAGSAGGRTDIWHYSIERMFTSPFGWPLAEFGFAHNFWLDLARNGGWLTMALGLIVACVYVLDLVALLFARFKFDGLFTTSVVSCSLCYFLLFMVEPILDGFFQCFAMLMFVWGGLARSRCDT